MANCPTCFNGSCPEVVPVTINNNTYSIDSVGITIGITQVSAVEVLATLTSDVADFQNISVYFVDSSADPTTKTVSPPPTPGWIESTLGTNVSGVAALTITNAGASDTWYLVVQGLNGVLGVSAAITIGV